MRRFIVIVLDSFGVGAMADTPIVRPQDTGANTCLHVLEAVPSLRLPNLCSLGLMNALGREIAGMKFAPEAVYGTSDLMHVGADTFFGHQEIMGTRPKAPVLQPFREVAEQTHKRLVQAGYEVKQAGGLLTVDDRVAIGDNLETDAGQVYNVSGCLDLIDFEEVLEIGRIVRSVASVSRVIALGGEGVGFERLMQASAVKANGRYAGIDTPSSGLYDQGYRVVHLGYGVDPREQVPYLLGSRGIDVSLIGKVADIVDNRFGRSLPGVRTEDLFSVLFSEVERMREGFICLNVQETDLAGHAQNAKRYAERLSVCDDRIGRLLERLGDEDILVVMADHGNDPTIGHSRHTRETVPILVRRRGVAGVHLGRRATMSDIGATAAEFLGGPAPENGQSFLNSLLVNSSKGA